MPEAPSAKQVVMTDQAAQPIGPYSQAIVARGFVFVAGEKGIDPRTGKMASGIRDQTRQTLENIRVLIAEEAFQQFDRSAVCGREVENGVIRNVYRTPAEPGGELPVVDLHNCRHVLVTE